MKFYNQKIVQAVREDRKNGLSIKKLEKKFKIPDSTISRWVRDIPSSSKMFNLARKKEQFLKSEFHNLSSKYIINNELSKILISLMYWCEGSKYPSSNFVAFANSDYKLIKTFLNFLRQSFEINESKIKIHLQIHSTHNKDKIIEFWSDLLQVPKYQFYKPTITKPTNSMKRLNYKGTCTIKYFDVKLLLQITGLYEGLAKKYGEVPERLKGLVC